MGGGLNMRFFLARPAHRRVPDEGFPRNGRLRLAVLAVSAALLSACTSTGASFQSSGLDRIVVGRTTMEQASGYLGAHPVDVWRQGDTTLARWAYKGSVATDAVYFRQEAWLRFGPDGTFQRMENSVNLPLNRRPRTAEEADQQARTEQAARQEASRPPVQTVAAPAATEGASEAVPVAVQAGDAIQPASLTIQPPAPAASGAKPARTRAGSAPARRAATGKTRSGQAKKSTAAADRSHSPAANPLLPAGTRVIPGVTYPVRKGN